MIGWVVLENIQWSQTQNEDEKAWDVTVDKIEYDLQKVKKMNIDIFPNSKSILKFGNMKRMERIESNIDNHDLVLTKKISIGK